MINIKTLHYRQLKTLFGNPETEEGREKIKSQLITMPLPYSFYNMINGKLVEIKNIRVNKYILLAVVDALEEILNHYGKEKIKELGLDREFGGCYNHRKTRNGLWWSVHAWGTAADIWCHMGKYRKESTIPAFCIHVFKKRGFCWGGDFPIPDGMHFSCCFG